MPLEPQVKPLSLLRRRLFFVLLLLAFCLALPAAIFYAVGYRYNPFAERPAITATGGIYVISAARDTSVYINEELITDARTFRNATYIQGLETGVHRLHVQSPGAHTWVKELLITPHIVTEVQSFNVPLIPRVRVVGAFSTLAGVPVVLAASSTTVPFAFASTTNTFIATTSRATTTLIVNSEYAQVATLFTEKASTTARRKQLENAIAADRKRLGDRATTSATTTAFLRTATTTVIMDDLMLYQQGEDVYVRALGTGRSVPAYFCAVATSTATPSSEIGTSSLVVSSTTRASTGTPFTIEFSPGELERRCRTDIRIDRKWQTVHDFMFMPGESHLVLLRLDDGLHVVEVDDRSWQNTQLLYPGENLAVVTDGGRIYASSTEGVVEVFTEIPNP